MKISHVIKSVWGFISRANKYIDETAPWALAKDPAKKQELANVMYNLMESLRIISVLIEPFMPSTAEKIWQQLNMPEKFADIRLGDIKTWGKTPANLKIGEAQQLFPRIEVEEAVEEKPAKKNKQENNTKSAKNEKAADGAISIEDFSKVQLRVAEIIEAEAVPKADKLLKLKVSLGDEQREVVSGIAKHYEPQDLIGKKVILVANLKPAKIRGVVSHGMILAASADDELQVVTTDMPAGSIVK